MLHRRFLYWTVSDLFSRWSKSRLNFLIYRPIVFYLRRNTYRKWHRRFTNAADYKYKCIHIELVQVFYDIKWISSGAFEFEKKPNNNQWSVIVSGSFVCRFSSLWSSIVSGSFVCRFSSPWSVIVSGSLVCRFISLWSVAVTGSVVSSSAVSVESGGNSIESEISNMICCLVKFGLINTKWLRTHVSMPVNSWNDDHRMHIRFFSFSEILGVNVKDSIY